MHSVADSEVYSKGAFTVDLTICHGVHALLEGGGDVATGAWASCVASMDLEYFEEASLLLSGPPAPSGESGDWTQVGFPSRGTKFKTVPSIVQEAEGTS